MAHDRSRKLQNLSPSHVGDHAASVTVAQRVPSSKVSAIHPEGDEIASVIRRQDAARFAEVLTIKLDAGMRDALTEQQHAFVYEVYRDFDVGKAAGRAGYQGNLPQVGYRLMHKPHIKRAIDALGEQLDEADGMTQAWIERRLRALADAASATIPVLDRKGNPTGEYRADWSAAARCLELIGKLKGYFTQQIRVEHGGEIRHLLEAVAAAGKPSLEERKRNSVTIEHPIRHAALRKSGS